MFVCLCGGGLFIYYVNSCSVFADFFSKIFLTKKNISIIHVTHRVAAQLTKGFLSYALVNNIAGLNTNACKVTYYRFLR